MNRLSRYLFKLFSVEAAALFGVAITLLFLVQCLRVIDAGSVRGKGLLTLLSQAVLGLPPTGMAFLYVCVAVGLARALRALQTSRELHIIHVGGRLPVLLRAIGVFMLAGTLIVWFLAHVVEPATTREANLIKARIAADLVGRSLVPNRFAEVTDGVTITVGGRKANGEITSFFADDRRQATRRTYLAQSALITADELGYVLQLRDGAIQYRTPEGRYSEISFVRYDIALERLTGDADRGDQRGDNSSFALISKSIAEGQWPGDRLRRLNERTVEGLRVVALCLLVTALCAFPSGRRKEPVIPIEITILVAAFIERGIVGYLPKEGWLTPLSGVTAVSIVSLLILLVRLRVFLPQPRKAYST